MTGPERLVADLEARGWTVAGRGRGQVRLAWPGLREHTSLFVPTDVTAPDFGELWQAALGELEDAVATGVQAAYVLAGLHGTTHPVRTNYLVPQATKGASPAGRGE